MEHDWDEALRWYRISAENGYAEAQYSLACMLDKGIVIQQDSQTALEWARKAAGQGFYPANLLIDEIMERQQSQRP